MPLLRQVDRSIRTGEGGGGVAEGEDIRMETYTVEKAMDMVARGEIQETKTIIALQYMALRRLEQTA